MYKKISITLATILFASGIYCQVKTDPRTVLFSKLLDSHCDNKTLPDSIGNAHMRISTMLPGQSAQHATEVLLTLAREMTEAELIDLGVVDPIVIGMTAVGSINLSDISNLEECDNIVSVSLSGRAKLRCDMARADVGVDVIRNGEMDLPMGYDGSGVIVSLFDQGIEPGHINFLSADRTESRVKQIWHYNTYYNDFGAVSTTETGYLTPEEIAEFKTDDDTQTHGTHTLGIMTGSFGVNKEDPNYDYSGMAPGSDILIGCGSLSYNNVIRAIKRFQEYAAEENKPLVVNLSFGDNIGPHDGTDAFPKALNELAETIPVFMSAGNEANYKITINKTLTETDREIKTVIVPRNTIKAYLGVSWEAVTEVQIWSEDETPFTVHTGLWDKSEEEWVFRLPTAADGEASYIANGAYEAVSNYQNDDFDYLYQDSAIGISTGFDPNNRRYTADIWYMLNKQTNHIDRNIVPVLIISGEPGKRIDVYCDGDYNEFDTGRQDGWNSGSADGTISNIACGKNTIAVGSYCTRKIVDNSEEGEVSEFSSWGVLYDGRVLPDILAPGECIASSMSTPFTASEYYSEQTNPAVYGLMYGDNNPFYWTIMSGTSQAAPAMAGIAALWLQANPSLTPADIKQIATETARPTPEMTPQCGAGKVDALEGLKKALATNSVEVNSINPPSKLLITSTKGNLMVENLDKGEFTVDIFDVTGRFVKHLVSGNADTIEIRDNDYGLNGIYILKVSSSNETITRKVSINF